MTDWNYVKNAVNITDVADVLLKKDPRRKEWYYSPMNEKTPSLRIYTAQNSFYDYSGRGVTDRKPGGDCINLWAYCRNVDLHQALIEMMDHFRLVNPDQAQKTKQEIREEIQRRERAESIRKAKEEQKRQRKIAWIDFLKMYIQNLESALQIQEIKENIDLYHVLLVEIMKAEESLDRLCSVEHGFKFSHFKKPWYKKKGAVA